MNNLAIENARILFPNFSGVEGRYNRAGDRNFCVAIEDPAQAQAMLEDGWNVRILAPRNEDEQPLHYISVAVKFDGPFPPKVMLINGQVRTLLDEESVGELDHVDIANADIIIRPRQWEVNGNTGVKAYLKALYITVEQDEFSAKYDNF